MKKELFAKLESLESEMTKTLAEMIAFPAINPIDGGSGEFRKAQYILKKIKELGFGEAEVYAPADPAAEGGERPNVVLRFPGRTKRRLWIAAHMDVVPAGELSLWETDPFSAVVKDGRIYGRGVNDNGQEIVSSLYALYALKELGLTPEFEVCLAFVANEEVGSDYGIKYLIKEGLFDKEDLVVVPDMGTKEGDFIEVAEKSICWIEFTAEGKQTHASTPEQGINACRAANAFSVSLDEALHAAFPEEDERFDPPRSTFEPTRRCANVDNVNTVPGVERFCFDCRVLPSVPLAEVKKVVEAEVKKAQEKYRVKIGYTFPQYTEAAEPTEAGAPVVKVLSSAIAGVFPGLNVRVGGVGGGTCAAYYREAGIPAAVWGQQSGCPHMPNEYTEIAYMLNEAKVFALTMLGE
ncbi:M20 family metallo-hydrolase [Synergistes jonesii]|uniref:Diaminopimelate aminotransferase n=1 Tax=Synergistes jonesii TaxID=2754 RepID=A0A073J3P2_9BACT|nr:M20 family metallo-hydrolase [Synergistes jonesii]KEJ92352.1 diaminopimelate aminotransferase [Synergistes jonesii]OFB62796.1 diaminopimelate aminotransferase [Synergistes jonesii]OFB63503.1 diaminopimelate aminotransferase [Synergistes jonesii]OFB65454.1 diaminopimelate aminotransferase [Synergistes jonesii]OFB67741.1 diaminopimelate aminotransferase [Synergistes jonesii]